MTLPSTVAPAWCRWAWGSCRTACRQSRNRATLDRRCTTGWRHPARGTRRKQLPARLSWTKSYAKISATDAERRCHADRSGAVPFQGTASLCPWWPVHAPRAFCFTHALADVRPGRLAAARSCSPPASLPPTSRIHFTLGTSRTCVRDRRVVRVCVALNWHPAPIGPSVPPAATRLMTGLGIRTS